VETQLTTDSASLSERRRSMRDGADDDIPFGDALQATTAGLEPEADAALTGRLRHLRKKKRAKIAATAANVTPNSVPAVSLRKGSARTGAPASSSRFA